MIALLGSLAARLTSDAKLQKLCGGQVNLHLNMAAPESPPFPYLVHKIESELQDDGISQEGSWLCDVWDYGSDAARAIRIGIRVKQLLHNATDPTLHQAGFEFRSMHPVKTDNDRVKRVALRFRLDWPDLDLVPTG